MAGPSHSALVGGKVLNISQRRPGLLLPAHLQEPFIRKAQIAASSTLALGTFQSRCAVVVLGSAAARALGHDMERFVSQASLRRARFCPGRALHQWSSCDAGGGGFPKKVR